MERWTYFDETTSLRRDLRRVMVIASSSRGGSSRFAELLRGAPALTHLPGEVNHVFGRHGLTWPDQESDAVGCAAFPTAVRDAPDTDLSAEADQPSDEWDAFGFIGSLARRLDLQWPDLTFGGDDLEAWTRNARRTLGRDDSASCDAALFHAEFLREVRTRHPQVNLYYFDPRQPVMATRDLRAPVLRRKDVREMMERPGDGNDPDTWE